MHNLIRQLQHISYSKHELIKSCLLILLLGLATAGITSSLLRFVPTAPPSSPDTFEAIYNRYFELKYPNVDYQFIPTETTFFKGTQAEWMPQLIEQVNSENPPPGAGFALGLWLKDEGKPEAAIDLFHRENLSTPHPLIRQCEI